ncbi:MAG: hypothetical protein ACR2IS_05160, partial [Nitrososphaeraceae archaeon]
GILPSANALPLEIGDDATDDAIDFPVTADSILGELFTKEEIKKTLWWTIAFAVFFSSFH